jgi:hypothetical protein
MDRWIIDQFYLNTGAPMENIKGEKNAVLTADYADSRRNGT